MALYVDKTFALMVREGLSKETREAFLPVTELGKADFYILALLLAWAIGRAGFLRAAPMGVAKAWAALARASGFIMASLAFSALFVHILKLTVGRARPKELFQNDVYGAFPFSFDTHLSSFPSGHSQTVWSIMAALMFLYPRAWPLFAAWATVIASSRVIVGSHFPSDVLMGSFIAGLSALYVRQKWFRDAAAPRFKPWLAHGEPNNRKTPRS
jgi:membrane-associated phospholipid phosphatase